MRNNREIKIDSKRLLGENIKLPLIIMAVIMLVPVVLGLIAAVEPVILGSIAQVIAFLFSVYIAAYLAKYTLSFIHQKGQTIYQDGQVSIWTAIRLFAAQFIAMLIPILLSSALIMSSLYFFISDDSAFIALIGILSVLTVLISVIFSLMFAFVPFIIVEDESMGIFKSLSCSMKVTKGNKWRIFMMFLSFLGWMFLALFTFGLLYLWLIPYMSISFGNLYLELKQEKAI